MARRAAYRARRARPFSGRAFRERSRSELKTRLPGALSGVPATLQRAAKLGSENDACEREAEAVAGHVAAGRSAPSVSASSGGGGGIQRDAAPSEGGAAGAEAAAAAVRTGGRRLNAAERGFFEPRFGQDFSDVRVHSGQKVDAAAASIGARAYTVGSDIAFASGEYAPDTGAGRRLMAHELTHTLQQSGGGQSVQRQSAGSDDEPRATDYNRVELVFNGSELIVFGDGVELFRYDGDSGRPVQVSEEDAEACGADSRTDTYLNDARFTGVRNMGPIPAGEYRLSPSRITEFSTGEQIDLLVGGILGDDRVTVGGRSVHAGDWGAGRVHLRPVRLEQGPCGNVHRRSGFFLHGGVLRGSSGCIDIQTSFDELAAFLEGYRRNVTLRVNYDDPATRVGFWTGLGGGFAYSGFSFANQAALLTGVEHSAGDTRFVASAEYDAVLDWAGGALSAGVHVDIPVDDREAFVRAGLRANAEFRVLAALYGRIMGGGYYESAHDGLPAGGGLQAGGGLGYNFGPVQIEALYNLLAPIGDDDAASGDPRREAAHQALTRIGFEW